MCVCIRVRPGSPITRVPIMAKQPLDLYRLFKLVVERGGLVEVKYLALLVDKHNANCCFMHNYNNSS